MPSHEADPLVVPAHGGPRRLTAVVAWTTALLLPAGIGLAVWSASGSGPGAAGARTAQPLVVTAGTPVADLFPGATGSVHLSVANPNPYPVTITGGSVTAVTGVTGAAGSCAASDFSVGGGTVASTGVPASGSAGVTLTGALTMRTTAGDGCQGATVTVTATVTGSQS